MSFCPPCRLNPDRPHGYTVTYDSSSHMKVIFQCWGSVWPKVFPYCLLNACISALLEYLQASQNVSLAISDKGHSFMNLMVSFLIVSRVTISVGRYMEARTALGTMYCETRSLIQNVMVFSDALDTEEAKAWRTLVAYRSNILLRCAMAVIDFTDPPHTACWELSELDDDEKTDIQKYIFIDTGKNNGGCLKYGHGPRTMYEENMRVPIRMAMKLRQVVRQHKSIFLGAAQIQVAHELKMMANIDAFLNGYYSMCKFLTTPFPFPLIQMARTFLFFYVYSVPFALLSDKSSPYAHVFIVFILTFGFMGLEHVSMELDNPFGNDSNDFDNLGMAYATFEDTYLTILSIDGPKWANELRIKMHDVKREGVDVFPSEQRWLLSTRSIAASSRVASS